MWHRVYVILLDDEARCPGSGTRGHVYVGETALTREERFANHKEGGVTASRVVTNHGVRLMPDLYKHIKAFRSREEAEVEEKKLREELLKAGWRVCGGTRGMSEGLG